MSRRHVVRCLQAVILLVLAQAAAPGLGAQCTLGNPTGCVIAPATVEVNLGALPVDKYQDCVLNNHTYVPTCNDPNNNKSVRTCIQEVLAGYRTQGGATVATGVRFLFGLGGGGYSTPFNPTGHGLRPWLAKLNDFLKDVHDAGYTKVTPTPVLVEAWSAVHGSPFHTDQTGVSSCGTTKKMRWFPWLPFGLEISVNDECLNNPSKACNPLPDCAGYNNAYNVAASNPHFWGWASYFNLMDFVFQKVQANGLDIADFDVQNELDLFNFTVLGRLIYDNTTSVDVIGEPNDPERQPGIRGKMRTYFGQDADTRVTFSTMIKRPSYVADDPNFNCPSFYGDSAMIIRESERLAAFGHAAVGKPSFTPSRNLWCEGEQGDMITLPPSYTQPSVTNIHAHICYAVGGTGLDQDNCTTQSAAAVANTLYSEVWKYLYVRGLTSNKVMFGEVNHTQTGSPERCLAFYNYLRAYDNVDGFVQSKQSAYYQYLPNGGANVVLRVWQNIQDSCYTVPNTIKPPYGPPQ